MFGFNHISKRLVAAYVFDWVMIVVIAALSLAFSRRSPNYRPFSLLDLDISFPHEPDTVTVTYLAIASVVGPAIIIAAVSVFLVPGPAQIKKLPWRTILTRKFWEWMTGWMGLALSLATATLVSQGMKNIFGRPRPDLLSRCMPDMNNIAAHTVGGYGQDISPRWVLVEHTICQQTNASVLDDGFRSFPSGHCTTAFAGLLYLTLWLCAKFSIVFPYLPNKALQRPAVQGPTSHRYDRDEPTRSEDTTNRPPLLPNLRKKDNDDFTEYRDEAAAPPTWILLLAYVPIGAAIFIAGSRFFDYKHHAWDIVFGSLIGIATAWIGFRWYHLPIAQGAGWSWGPRSPGRAFAVGVGTHGYVSLRERIPEPLRRDVELGPMQPQGHGDRSSEAELLNAPGTGTGAGTSYKSSGSRYEAYSSSA